MKCLGKLDRREAIVGWMFILPTILILLTIRGIPMVTAFVKSFTNWDGMYKNDFVGLKNYILILGKEEFWALLKNNLVLLLFIPIQVLIGVMVAVLLFEEVRGWKVFRSLYYIPQVISPLIIGFLFAVLFGYNGPINILLRGIGLNAWAIDWLGSGGTALPVIIFCLVWINIGWQGMLVLGGIGAIPLSVYEAAKLDGAGYWRRLFSITIPMIQGTIRYSVMMSVIWSFTSLFPFIYSMTRGGPGTETMTIDYMIYQKSFVTGSQMGYSCALSVILLVIILVFTVVQMRLQSRGELKEQ